PSVVARMAHVLPSPLTLMSVASPVAARGISQSIFPVDASWARAFIPSRTSSVELSSAATDPVRRFVFHQSSDQRSFPSLDQTATPRSREGKLLWSLDW